MRKVFGFLFVLFAVISLPSVLDFYPSTAVLIGRVLAWSLMSVIPAFLLLRSSGKKKDCQVIEKTEQKKSPVKKIFKILLSAIGILLLCAAILSQVVKTVFMPFIEHDRQRAEFAQSIERADRNCPIPVALGKGAVTGIKLEDDYVTCYIAYDSDVTNILSKIDDEQKIREGILMSMLCLNAQNGNMGDIVMDSLEKFGYGIRIIITQSGTGKFDFKASTEEIRALRQKYQYNPHEALFNLLSLSIEAERASLPLQIDEGMLLTDYSLDDENIVISVKCDEKIYSIDAISSNRELVKESIFKELDDPSSKSLLDMCKISHTGIKYIFTGNRSHKTAEILFSSDEIRQNVETPSQVNIQ